MNRRSFLFTLPLIGFIPKLSALLPSRVVEPAVDELNAATLEYITPRMVSDMFFGFKHGITRGAKTWDGNIFTTYQSIERNDYDQITSTP